MHHPWVWLDPRNRRFHDRRKSQSLTLGHRDLWLAGSAQRLPACLGPRPLPYSAVVPSGPPRERLSSVRKVTGWTLDMCGGRPVALLNSRSGG